MGEMIPDGTSPNDFYAMHHGLIRERPNGELGFALRISVNGLVGIVRVVHEMRGRNLFEYGPIGGAKAVANPYFNGHNVSGFECVFRPVKVKNERATHANEGFFLLLVNVLRVKLPGKDPNNLFAIVPIHDRDHHNSEFIETIESVVVG
jgi:hypothetical protein